MEECGGDVQWSVCECLRPCLCLSLKVGIFAVNLDGKLPCFTQYSRFLMRPFPFFFFKDIRLKGTVVPFFFFSVRCLKKKKEKKCITQIQVGDRFDSPIQSTVNVATSPRLRSPLWRSRFNRCYCTFAPN